MATRCTFAQLQWLACWSVIHLSWVSNPQIHSPCHITDIVKRGMAPSFLAGFLSGTGMASNAVTSLFHHMLIHTIGHRQSASESQYGSRSLDFEPWASHFQWPWSSIHSKEACLTSYPTQSVQLLASLRPNTTPVIWSVMARTPD